MERRKAEIDRRFMKVYEDWSANCITEYNFNMLSQKYQNEQAEFLNALIKKIVIYEATKNEDDKREQEIEIYYRFIGKND